MIFPFNSIEFSTYEESNYVPQIANVNVLEKQTYGKTKRDIIKNDFSIYCPAPVEDKPQYVEITNPNTFNLTTKSNVSLDVLTEYLSKYEKLSNWGLAEILTDVEKKYNINAIFLLSIIRLESGNGTSGLAIYDNNLCGIKVEYEYISYKSKEACVWDVAELLAESYLKDNGRWFNGYTVSDVNINYCSDAEGIEAIMAEINESIIEIMES